jgi:hypothetical protein
VANRKCVDYFKGRNGKEHNKIILSNKSKILETVGILRQNDKSKYSGTLDS